VLRVELNAWLAHARAQDEASVGLMREASELEASTPKHPVTPGPTLPADEQLGDLLMELKRPAEALAAYERSMSSYPKRFNGLLGAARASRSTGDESAAHAYYGELLEVAGHGTRQAPLDEARRPARGTAAMSAASRARRRVRRAEPRDRAAWLRMREALVASRRRRARGGNR
jgi:predicted Zn-dependent protease